MRIVRVAERVPPCVGGKERHIRALTTQNEGHGHTVELVFGEGEGSKWTSSATCVRGSKLLQKASGTASAVYWALKVVLRHRRLLQAGDVVHVHGDIGLMAVLIGASSRPVRIMTVHGALNSWMVRIKAYRLLNRFVDVVFALGPTVVEQLTNGGLERGKVIEWSSGVEDSFAGHRKWDYSGTARNPAVVLSVGSLIPLKNHGILIRAAALLEDVEVWLAGVGPEASSLQRLSDSLGVRLKLLGQLDDQDLLGAYRSASCYVLASTSGGRKAEGVSTALLEALYLGLPSLVSCEALPGEQQREGLAAVFDPRDPADLAAKLRALIGEGEAGASRLSARAIACSRGLRWEQRAREFEAIARSTLSARLDELTP